MTFDRSPLKTCEILKATTRDVERIVNRGVPVAMDRFGFALFCVRLGAGILQLSVQRRLMTDDNRLAVWNGQLDRDVKVAPAAAMAIGRFNQYSTRDNALIKLLEPGHTLENGRLELAGMWNTAKRYLRRHQHHAPFRRLLCIKRANYCGTGASRVAYRMLLLFTMRTFQIPHREWCDRLNEFSRAHEGWPVALDIFSESIGAQPEFRLLSLAGVTAEPNQGGRISITAALPSGGFVTHTIRAPIKVSIAQTDAGADAALEIEAADGTRAILHFRVAPP